MGRAGAFVVRAFLLAPLGLVACGSGRAETPFASADGGRDAGVDAGRAVEAGGDAAAADAGTGAVGVLGQPCSPTGSLACEGNEQKLQLLCDATGRWVANGTCSGSQLCDTAPGMNAGTCQDPVPQCAGQDPGFMFCIPSGGPELETCGPDLVTVTTMDCPAACANGKCVACEPNYWICNGLQPQECLPSGGGDYAWTNQGPPCAGSCNPYVCKSGPSSCCQ